MRLRRWMCLALAGAMTLSLCSCRGGNTDETGSEAVTEDQTDPDVPETSDGDLTVHFDSENLVDAELDEEGNLASVTYKAGDREVTFQVCQVTLNDDGSLLFPEDYGELVTVSGVENCSAVTCYAGNDEIGWASVFGLKSLDSVTDGAIFGYDYESGDERMYSNDISTTNFGYTADQVGLMYSTAGTPGSFVLSSITFQCQDTAKEPTGELIPFYLRCYEITEEEYGDDYSVVWDFSDASIIADSVTDGDYLTSLSLYNDVTGETEQFACDKCKLEDGILTIEDGGSMVLLTEMGGIGHVDVTVDPSVESYGIVRGGYNEYNAASVDSEDDLIWSVGGMVDGQTQKGGIFDGLPNYFKIESYMDNILAIAAITVRYDNVTTSLRSAYLDTDFYGYYLEGDTYDEGLEHFSEEDGIYSFYLRVVPDSPYYTGQDDREVSSIFCIDMSKISIGNLLASDGSVKDKSEPLACGDQIEVILGDYTLDVDLPVCSLFTASNLKELMPASTVSSTGTVNVLVVPCYFEDQADAATEANLKDIYPYLGRVLTEDGQVQDYTDGSVDYSLSEYFDRASYGQLNLNSFVTDWYALSGTYEEEGIGALSDDRDTLDQIRDWVNENYLDMNAELDQDQDGLYDAVIFLNAAPDYEVDEYITISYQGAYNSMTTYDYAQAITDGSGSGINHFTNLNMSFFTESGKKSSGTLCHEFSHQLGLIDYYDVYGYGIDAVGAYDMESSNEGDWNAYSKYAAGWINPAIVTEEDIDQGISLTINAFEEDGSAIVIPTENTTYNEDGTISPFSEYLLVDLFTPDGLYADTCGDYGLTEAGVRIYHVDGRMLTIEDLGETGETYTVGSCLYTNAYNESGRYMLELIQASGINTFTDYESDALNPVISDSDLFKAGSSFSASTHSAFFDDGRMDDGSEIDYTIHVDSIENGTATITISR